MTGHTSTPEGRKEGAGMNGDLDMNGEKIGLE